MTRYRPTLAAIPLLAVLVPAARAEEQPIERRPGPGQEETQNSCGACHSLDYIKMNSPFLTAEQWQGVVTKMRQVYGAPVEDADAAAIIAYLGATYAGGAK